MDPGSWGSLAVAGAGVAAGAYATWIGSKAQKRSLKAEKKAAAFTAADSMIENLQDDNKTLREEMRTARREHADELAAMRKEHAAEMTRMVEEHRHLRAQCQENDERNAAAIQALQQDNANLRREMYDQAASLVGLRVLVVDEVAREAARDELGNLDPDAARRLFRELMNPSISNPPERRLGTSPDRTPPEGDRRRRDAPEAVDDFGGDDP